MTTTSEQIRGGCLCGRVRYFLTEAPTRVGDCHCVDCQRAAGAVYVTFGSIPRTAFRVESGETRDIDFAGRRRTFAPCCGTSLLYQSSATAENIAVTIASLDEPEKFPSTHAIWLNNRISWVHLDPALEKFPFDDEEGAAA